MPVSWEYVPMEYRISSRDYLKRARARLGEIEQASLIYAALELRCGIEARMIEYLEVQAHISKKKKKGWRVAELARNVEAAFRTGEKIVRWAVHDKDSDAIITCFYYTPVTSRLQKAAEMLGNYLHSIKKFKARDDPYWVRLRNELEGIATQLELANKGTLLGPPLMKPGTNQVDMKLELPPEFDPNGIMKKMLNKELKVHVSYLKSLPDNLEREACVWSLAG